MPKRKRSPPKRTSRRSSKSAPAPEPANEVQYVVDRREPLPGITIFLPGPCTVRTLKTGDYTVAGYEEIFSFERKSGRDLIGTVGSGRSRFEKEIYRLREFPIRVILAETTWKEIQNPFSSIYRYSRQITPSHVLGAISGWIVSGVPVLFTHNQEGTALAIQRIVKVGVNRIERIASS